MKMMSDSHYQTAKTRLDELSSTQQELKEQHTKARSSVEDLERQIRQAQEQIEELTVSQNASKQEMVQIAQQHNPLNTEISELEQKIADHERASKIQAIFDEQTTFFDALEQTFDKVIEELKPTVSDFVEFTTAQEATQNTKRIVESSGFNEQAAYLRSVRSHYEQAIRDLCEKKLDGNRITLTESRLPFERLAQEIHGVHFVSIWQK